MAKLKEEEKQKKKDGAILPRVMTALTVKVLLKELSDECGSEYSSEEDKVRLLFDISIQTMLTPFAGGSIGYCLVGGHDQRQV